MTAAELLSLFKRLGIRLEVHGGRLMVDVPKGVMTPEMREALAAHRDELMTILSPSRLLEEHDESQQEHDEDGRAPYLVLVNGRVGAEAHTKDEAVRAFDDAVRGIGSTETTVTVELVDDEGKRLRVAYFPPWPG